MRAISHSPFKREDVSETHKELLRQGQFKLPLTGGAFEGRITAPPERLGDCVALTTLNLDMAHVVSGKGALVREGAALGSAKLCELKKGTAVVVARIEATHGVRKCLLFSNLSKKQNSLEKKTKTYEHRSSTARSARGSIFLSPVQRGAENIQIFANGPDEQFMLNAAVGCYRSLPNRRTRVSPPPSGQRARQS